MPGRRWEWAVWLLGGLLFAAAGRAADGPGGPRPLVLNTDDAYPLSTPEQTGMHDRILREAFARLGVAVDIVHLPSERALRNADAGIEDGNFVRIAGLDALYPNLLRVPEKITDYEFVVFTKSLDFTPRDWGSLTPFEVGIITGWKILEQNISAARTLIKVRDQHLLFNLLEKDRVQLIVYSRYEGYGMLKQLGLRDIKVLEPPLATREMFLYLHKKHAALVPRLAQALRDMKQDGSHARIVEDSLAPLRPR